MQERSLGIGEFISYRYAVNLVDGNGLVFNAGDLWNDPRLETDYHWDEKLKGYRINY